MFFFTPLDTSFPMKEGVSFFMEFVGAFLLENHSIGCLFGFFFFFFRFVCLFLCCVCVFLFLFFNVLASGIFCPLYFSSLLT